MPYQIKSIGDGKYQLILKKTGQVLAKSTTKKKAEKQIQAIEINKKRGYKK
jgi:hypothetical protein